ncbi:MAG: FKBP-type peptidyl-prolyl cis-trans isomerase [Arenimonas sp.]|nr:FKBP-type peptidyl-prolyl cis-trans isomerase [Arenimonas sp.]
MKTPLSALATALLAFAVGSASAQDTTSDRGKLSYALGYRAGLEVGNVIKTGETLDMATVQKAFQDAASGKDPAVQTDQLAAAMDNMRNRLVAKRKALLEKRAADNKAKSDAFLAQNRSKAGVKVLPSGVQYRVIAAGNGPRPTQANLITVEFRNTLPDGTVLSDTNMASEGQPAGPVTVRLSEIPFAGLREALQLMPAGSRWDVVIPGSQAHGTAIERAGEMTNQALIFDITLNSVGAAVAAPKPGG